MKNSEILIAYFSASGVTAAAARRIAAVTGGEIFEIEPVEKYSTEDLDWTNKHSRSTLEMNDPHSRPQIAVLPEDFAKYTTVYIGFPIWWYVEPKIIDTFLESVSFANKTVIPFATSGGSDLPNVERHLHTEYPNIKWGRGKLLNRTSDKDIAAWAGL